MTIPEGPAVGDAVDGAYERREALASWLALTVPGILLTGAVVALPLVAAPWLMPRIYIAPSVRLAAAALFVAHCITSILILPHNNQWPAAVALLSLLAMEAFGAGVLLGIDRQLQSPALAVTAGVVGMSAMAGGWPALANTAAIAIGASAAIVADLSGPWLVSPTLWLTTSLSVETSFANGPGIAATFSFPTILSVETSLAGTPVLPAASSFSTVLSVEPYIGGLPAIERSAQLFVPALDVVLLGICVGAGVSILRARKARAAVAVAIVAAQRAVTQA